jgi:serine protease inhibitor
MRSGILEKNLFLLFSFLLLLLSCEKTTDNLPTDPVPIDLTTTQVSLVDSGNSFAFDIFRKILDNTAEDKNIIISPMSISYALSMAVNGANNSTRDSILKAMRVNGITMDDLNKSYRDLTSALLSVDERVKISIANSVWTEKEFNPKQQFIDILTSYYSAEARSFDVKDPSAPDEINAWIEDKTNGLIKDMVGQLDPLTVMLLINAVYFKGMWKYQFEESDTHPREFTLADGSGINVPSMSQSTDLKVYSGDGFDTSR